MKSELHVHGTVSVGTSASTGEGRSVHGLRVEVWDGGPCEPVCLGWSRTDRRGRYRITFCPPADDCPPQVHVIVRDREGRLLHDGREASCACPPEGSAVIDVELAPETLWWHTAEPTSWQRPDRPLVDPHLLDDVEDAVALLWPDRRRVDVLCDLPPLHAFGGLLDDAWNVLQGNPDAVRRFQGTLDLLCAQSDGAGDLADAVAEAVGRDCGPEPDCAGSEPVPARRRPGCGGACGCGCDDPVDPACPCGPASVDTDQATILVMATLHVSCGHRPTAIRHLSALLEQLCRLEQLAAVHTTITRALCGDADDLRHARELLVHLDRLCSGGGCGCADGFGCCATCIDDRLAACLAEAVCAWRSIDCYRVTDVSPPRACPGDEITLCGTGFGDVPGRVWFRRSNSLDIGPDGQVVDWCCDAITVVVPDGAGCGLVLALPTRTVEVCGRFLDVRPVGCQEVEFEGTSPEILKFDVAGRSDGDCVEPGTPLDISWTTCATDRVRVQIVNRDTGAVIDSLDPAPERGRWRFDGSGFTSTTRVEVRVRAEGICAPPMVERTLSLTYQARPDLSVEGLEVTQAIQHYRADDHLTDAADRGPDNSLRLVVGKSAWVRVYLRSGQVPTFDGGDLADIDGTLTVERRVGGVWSTVATLGSQNGPVDARDDFVNYGAERGVIDASLNFVVPASLMTGLLRFTADVASPHHCPGNQASGSATVDVNLQQTLRAAFITIGYDGPNGDGSDTLTLPAPDEAACQEEVAWALTTFPVSDADVRVAGTFTTNTPLNDPIPNPGGCSPSWGPLLQQVADLSDLDAAANPEGWVYYGIIAPDIPRLNSGCNWAASGGIAGRPITYAHEIGHQFGLPHSRCGGVGSGNANYPVYEPYDLPQDTPANPINQTTWTMASIGEFGLDINNGAIADPAFAEDFMSYCNPAWMSRFTHNFLVEDERLDPVTVPTGSGVAGARTIGDGGPGIVVDRGAEVEPLIVVTGRIEVDGSVEIGHVVRLDGRYRAQGRRGRPRVQLIGADGEVIDEDVVQLIGSIGCRGCGGSDGGDHGGCGCGGGGGCGCDDEQPEPIEFRAYLRDVADGSAIRVVTKGETVGERPCPERPPTVSRVRGTINKSGRLRITWSSESYGPETWAAVRWSADGGESWNALTTGLTERAAEVGLDGLPGGEVQFQVLVSDGFHTVTAESRPVDLPRRPPAVAILYPGASDRVYDERQIHLRGSATMPGSTLADDSFVWSIDGAEVGRGRDIWVASPGVGSHRVELSVAAPDGDAGTASRDITVLDPDGGGGID